MVMLDARWSQEPGRNIMCYLHLLILINCFSFRELFLPCSSFFSSDCSVMFDCRNVSISPWSVRTRAVRPGFLSVARMSLRSTARMSRIVAGRAIRQCVDRCEGASCALAAQCTVSPDWLCVCLLHAALLSSCFPVLLVEEFWVRSVDDVRGRARVFALRDSSSGGVSRPSGTCEEELCLSCAALRTVGRVLCCCVQDETCMPLRRTVMLC